MDSSRLFNIVTIAYFASMVAFLVYLATRHSVVALAGNIGTRAPRPLPADPCP